MDGQGGSEHPEQLDEDTVSLLSGVQDGQIDGEVTVMMINDEVHDTLLPALHVDCLLSADQVDLADLGVVAGVEAHGQVDGDEGGG